MELRIFTLPFDPVLEGFPDELVKDFCTNKKVQKLESQFFVQEGRAYWSVAVHLEGIGDQCCIGGSRCFLNYCSPHSQELHMPFHLFAGQDFMNEQKPMDELPNV